MISVKEEANDKQFDEFTENFVQKVPTTCLYKFLRFKSCIRYKDNICLKVAQQQTLDDAFFFVLLLFLLDIRGRKLGLTFLDFIKIFFDNFYKTILDMFIN